jgi:hypothetical protein
MAFTTSAVLSPADSTPLIVRENMSLMVQVSISLIVIMIALVSSMRTLS